MRLVTYDSPSGPVAGVLAGDRVCPLAMATQRAGAAPAASVRELLALTSPAQRQAVGRAAAELVEADPGAYPLIGELALLPPVTDPEKIICLALNSKTHCAEAGIPEPPVPWFFPKWRTSLVGHNGVVNPPEVSQKIDWEGEVALVIGAVAKHVSETDALSVIAGVMPFNDISARDLLQGLETIAITKSGDGQAPCGPALVTLDEIADLNDLPYRTRVNGEVKQDGSTSDQIYTAAQTIASLTRTTTLLPGDVIALGTLLGVGLYQNPPQFLHEGDVVEVELDGVGTLRTVIGPSSGGPVTGPAAGLPAATAATTDN